MTKMMALNKIDKKILFADIFKPSVKISPHKISERGTVYKETLHQ